MPKVERMIFWVVVILLFLSFMLFGYKYYINKQKKTTENRVETNSESERKELDVDEVFVDISQNGKIMLYINSNNKNNSKYIGYEILNKKKELDVSVESSNYDVWNINGAYNYSFNDGKFTNPEMIVREGEWELALKEVGASDFVGGSLHGDEITTSAELLIDGKPADHKTKQTLIAKEVKFTTNSDLFRDNTISDKLVKIAEHKKTYIFNSSGMSIVQEVKFIESLTLNKSYLSMVPALRKSNQDNTGKQITDTLLINKKEYNVSESGFNIPGINNSQVDEVVLFGKDSGISIKKKITDKEPDIPTTFLISNSDFYNKLYFVFNPDEYEVSSGDVWKQTTEYEIKSK